MTDALLVSDQHVNEGFFASRSALRSGIDLWPQGSRPEIFAHPKTSFLIGSTTPINVEQTLQGWDQVQDQYRRWRRIFPERRSDEKATAIEAHIRRAQNSLKYLAGLHERAQKDRQFQQEMRWLAENRHRFSGKWIALKGEYLLAVGTTAKEVFSKVADRNMLPLVIRIDEEELPFAGW